MAMRTGCWRLGLFGLFTAAALVATAATAAPGPAPEPAAPPVLVLALIPQASPVTMQERWGPFVDRLSALAGVSIKLKLYEKMPAFEKDYADGVPDLLFAHPSMTAAAHLKQGYLPLVRDRKEVRGVVFVRKDSPYLSVKELAGKQLAFVGARSFCSVINSDALRNERTDLNFNGQHLGSTRNVLKAVVLGTVDAGSSLDVAIADEPPELQAQVRPLLTSRGVAPHPISAHPRVPPALRDRLVRAVLQMPALPEDRALLASIRMDDPVLAEYGRDYGFLEKVQ
jgi:phosphonate transport system substrate-binding protein